MSETFRAIVATETDGTVTGRLTTLSDTDLPEGDVVVDVAYSSLNYKDGLSVTGRGRVARRFPMVCGVDLVGSVRQSDSPGFKEGQSVLVTGYGLSETHPGGFTQRQRLRSEWLVALPSGLSPVQAMAIGTAGFTSMLCVMALEDVGIGPDGPGGSEILVTGAAGGVGSVAVAILAHLGYTVAASSGRSETYDYLRSLGAKSIVARSELSGGPSRPLDTQRWRGAIDTVGSATLASVLSQISYGGAVAACGLAGGNDLPASVLPFILRAIKLVGVESVQTPMAQRLLAWERLSGDLPLKSLEAMTTIEPLGRVPELAADILAGRTRGRVVIDVNA
jgi:acrylyl-CoA reductase (NADPH)